MRSTGEAGRRPDGAAPAAQDRSGRDAQGGEPGNGPGVALVVRALRLAAGPGCWVLVERAFRDAYGPGDGAAATCLFRILLQGLAAGARRPLRLGFVGAPGLSHDERALLQLIAAAQARDGPLLDAGIAWLVRPRAAGSVGRTVAELGRVLAANGAILPRQLRSLAF